MKLKIELGIGILAVLLLAGNAEAATISSCTTISSPGTYTLTTDLLGMTGNPCIGITSSDVTLDGAGHLLDGQNSGTAILVNNPQTALTNVNIKNIRLTDWTFGIHYQAAILGTLTNNKIMTSSYGFFFDQYSGRNKFMNNNLTSNSYGFYITTGYNTITGNILNSNGNGIYVFGGNNTITGNVLKSNSNGIYINSNNNMVTDNTGDNNGNAFFFSSSDFNIIKRNTATYPGSTSGTGIYLASSDNNTVDSNIVTTYYGFYLSSANYNKLTANNASGHRGFDLSSASNNTLNGNTANTIDYGIVLSNSKDNKITRSTVKGVSQNGIWFSSSNNNLIYDNLFNNTANYFNSGGTSVNTWNIAPKQSVINIVNGLYTAGNVWDNPTKTGFSQICSDANRNGLCDSADPLDASNIDNFPLVHHADTTIPKSVTGLHNVTYQNNYIKWTWTDPTDTDFSYVKIYIDGIFKAGVLHGVQAYNATGFLPNTSHTIGTRTVDINGNQNAIIVTNTARTKPDTTAPGTVSNLKNITYAQTYITWTWTDPADYDLTQIKVWIDGTFKANVLKGVQKYNATGFTAGTSHTISTRAQDTSGNLGAWKNNTAKTKS